MTKAQREQMRRDVESGIDGLVRRHGESVVELVVAVAECRIHERGKDRDRMRRQELLAAAHRNGKPG